MKPRTKLQVKVFGLSKRLPDIDKSKLDWARQYCFDHKGFATKNRVICMDCGETFSPEIVNRKRAICPHCGTKLKIENTRKRKDKQIAYFTVAEVAYGFQIIRNFEIIIYYKQGEKANVFSWEILQHWISEETGKHEIVSRIHNFNYWCDSWSGDLEIRKEYTRWYLNGPPKYDVYPTKIHPSSKFLPKYKFYGIDYRLKGLTPLKTINYIPKNSRAETLLKAKQYSILNYCHSESNFNRHWASIKICMRNKYIVRDASMYFDYLDTLDYFHKDLHNAHYVCPKNLKRQHDIYEKKKRRQTKKQDAERKRRKAIEDENVFRELKQKFFGIKFSKGDINVKVLESVQEYFEEGETMHHCVFSNEYYLKPKSLILSARINEKPIETIEVSLNNFSIIQARGKNNLPTDYHDDIVNLVNKNMSKIKRRHKEIA